MKRALCIILGLALSGSALADVDSQHPPWDASNIYDGAKLFVTHQSPSGLSEDQRFQVTWAYGWLLGVESTLEASGLEGRDKAMICVAEPPTPKELARMYVTYVDTRPESRQANAASILMDALRIAYPCK